MLSLQIGSSDPFLPDFSHSAMFLPFFKRAIVQSEMAGVEERCCSAWLVTLTGVENDALIAGMT